MSRDGLTSGLKQVEETRSDRIARRAYLLFVSVVFATIMGIVALFGFIVFALWLIGRMFPGHAGD